MITAISISRRTSTTIICSGSMVSTTRSCFIAMNGQEIASVGSLSDDFEAFGMVEDKSYSAGYWNATKV